MTALSNVDANSGRTDSYGGHTERATGHYHIHNGGSGRPSGGGSSDSYDSYDGGDSRGGGGGSSSKINILGNSFDFSTVVIVVLVLPIALFLGLDGIGACLGCLGYIIVVGLAVRCISYPLEMLVNFLHISREYQGAFVWYIMIGTISLIIAIGSVYPEGKKHGFYEYLRYVGIVIIMVPFVCLGGYSICYLLQRLHIGSEWGDIIAYSILFCMFVPTIIILVRWIHGKLQPCKV